MKLRPIAIPKGFGALDLDLPGVELDLSDTPQGLGQYVPFEPQLRVISGMLILAATAPTKHGTRRLHAIRRRLLQTQEPRSLDVLPRLRPLGLDGLTRQYKWREDDLAIQPAQPFTAINQLFNVELQTYEG
jgi:hypothetical protein